MTNRPHIIAAKLPSGMTSRPHEHGDHIPPRDGICSVGRHGGEKAGHLFNATTRRSIEARLNGKPVHVRVGDLDADLRIIGFGLAAGALFVVILRLAQLGWLS